MCSNEALILIIREGTYRKQELQLHPSAGVAPPGSTKTQMQIECMLEKFKKESTKENKTAIAESTGKESTGSVGKESEKQPGLTVTGESGTNPNVQQPAKEFLEGELQTKVTVNELNWDEIPFELASIQRPSGVKPVPGTALHGLFSWIVESLGEKVGCYSTDAPEEWDVMPCGAAKTVCNGFSVSRGLICRAMCCGKTFCLSDKASVRSVSLANYLWNCVPEEKKASFCEATMEVALKLEKISTHNDARIALKQFKKRLSMLMIGEAGSEVVEVKTSEPVTQPT